jgi:multiple sugar transport system permease protein
MRALSYHRREKAAGLVFIAPALILFLIFLAYPIVYGLLLSFTSNRNAGAALNYNGLSNYIRLFTRDSYFQISLKNNLIYALVFTPGVLIAALMVAMLLNANIRGKSALRTICFFPYLTSMVAVASVWNLILAPAGPVNQVLSFFGVSQPPGWLMDKDWALYSVIIVAVWKNFGYYMIILLAGLQGIPHYLYESARIDGATPVKTFGYITLPMLSPTLFLCMVTIVIAAFQEFDLIKTMTDGGPGRATNVLVWRIYQEGFVNMKMGYASAIAYTLFAIIMLITFVQFILQKKWVNYD